MNSQYRPKIPWKNERPQSDITINNISSKNSNKHVLAVILR